MKVVHNCTLISASFNNATLTRIMLFSLFNKGIVPHIMIIDNGSTDFFVPDEMERRCGITVIDNHNYKLTKNWGKGQVSKNHCHSLQYALSRVSTEWAIICDNDILFKPSITRFFDIIFDNSADIIGEIGYDAVKPARLFPYLCAIKMNSIRNRNIAYFDPTRCMIPGVDECGIRCNLYDTGYSFYVDARSAGLTIKPICLDDYCVHYLHASQTSSNVRIPLNEWINMHSNLLYAG